MRTEEHKAQIYPPGDCGDDGKVWQWGYDGTTPGQGLADIPIGH